MAVTLEPQHLLANWYARHVGWIPTDPGKRPMFGSKDYRDYSTRNELWCEYQQELKELRASPRREALYVATFMHTGFWPDNFDNFDQNRERRAARWEAQKNWRQQLRWCRKELWGTPGITLGDYYKFSLRYLAWLRLQEKLYESKV